MTSQAQEARAAVKNTSSKFDGLYLGGQTSYKNKWYLYGKLWTQSVEKIYALWVQSILKHVMALEGTPVSIGLLY